MLIFDRFKDKEQAKNFAAAVSSKFKLKCHVCDSHEEANKIDVFPFELDPPIVLVERASEKTESGVTNLAKEFGGTFAGT